MEDLKIKMQIAKEAAEIKLNDMSGILTIEAALKQAQRNFNKIYALQQIISASRGEEDETEIHAVR